VQEDPRLAERTLGFGLSQVRLLFFTSSCAVLFLLRVGLCNAD
jgi:hypothetical protein